MPEYHPAVSQETVTVFQKEIRMTSMALRGTFQTFLEYHCDDRDLLVRNFEPLEPFFRFAGSGTYGRSVTPETGQIRSALTRATGLPAARVIGLPAENDSFAKTFRDEPGLSLAALLKERHFSAVISGPGRGTGAFTGLGWRTERLWKKISDDLGSAVRRVLPPQWSERAWSSVDMALLAYLGYTLAGNAQGAEEIRPLVELFPACIPLRQHRERESAWLVLLF